MMSGASKLRDKVCIIRLENIQSEEVRDALLSYESLPFNISLCGVFSCPFEVFFWDWF
jgi:hypothetical protein